MGASGWNYYVPYQEDLAVALEQLRQRVFQEGEYFREPEDEPGERPEPATIEELWEDEEVQESGTHSILDMFRVVGPGEAAEIAAVQPVTSAEVRGIVGAGLLTREHVRLLEPLASERWFGRCAVLHDVAGKPQEIYFWGFSGD